MTRIHSPKSEGQRRTRRGKILYQLVAEALRRKLAEGDLPAGAKIPSLRSLAKQFNVSTMTVNQALKLLKRDGLITYIPAVGAFVKDGSAGRAATARMAIAFVTIEIETTFTSRLAAGIEEACRNRGWALQICNAETRPEIEAQHVARLPNSGISGAIMLPTSDEANFEAMFRLRLEGFPFVLVDRSIQGLKVDVVESDHERGAYLATQHLLAHGHRRIHMLSCRPGLLSSADARWHGYERALLDHGIEPLREWRLICDDCQRERPLWLRWYDAALPELGRLSRPAAVVALNAYAGRGLLEACRKLGLRVPEDISLVSFDDTEFMQAFSPPITVIAQRTREIGRLAVEQLERRIQAGAGPEPRHLPVEMDLIERESVLRIGPAG